MNIFFIVVICLSTSWIGTASAACQKHQAGSSNIQNKAEEPIILAPLKDGIEAVLLLVPGAYINAAFYEPLGVAIQTTSSLKLWVGLVRPFVSDLPNPVQCSDDIEKTLSMMRDQGMVTSLIAVAGHSLGGVVMQDWISANLANVTSMILMASQLNNAEVANSSLATLHISGDLDGLEEITELEPTFRRLESSVSQDPEAVFRKPTVVLRDVNHMHFASGAPPPLVQSDDILSPLSEEEAHALLAVHMSAFLTSAMQAPPDEVADARALLQQDFYDTQDIMRPLAEMRELTSTGTLSPFATIGQQILSNLDPLFYSSLFVNDTSYEDLAPFESHQPVSTLVGDVAQVNTYSLVTDAGPLSSYSSAEELAIKFKNSDDLKKVLASTDAVFLDSNVTCLDVNQEAINAALSSGGVVVTGRYESRGRPILLRPDSAQQTGPEWLNAPVNYTLTDAGLEVQSASLVTAVSVPFGFDGMYYCKLMPPSRALEYIMIDSLRGTQPVARH
ncbi:uncharacterized protein LOC108673941 [Hyalella azteca]|uniref:Uncharacterized protein LOC108673941 n=1 Tax=Hyalella azteca TaxID=294128 RepID=A0A8B7NUC9_HYAAZ|nr:uncharacterized protein LOC108673941 [Hyalella azteca]